MDQKDIRRLLEQVKSGGISVEAAVEKLKVAPFEDLGYAKVDHHRGLRQGAPEVIYGAGKSATQILGIVRAMMIRGEKNVLITRLPPEAAEEISRSIELSYDPVSRIGLVGKKSEITATGTIVVATGGTSDIPVAEEAAQVAEAPATGSSACMTWRRRAPQAFVKARRSRVRTGRHSCRGHGGRACKRYRGLVDCPVIAVPTSIGYGASFSGLAALLSMLNSCASGVSVVNIDNGFGAGYLASMINHIGGTVE